MKAPLWPVWLVLLVTLLAALVPLPVFIQPLRPAFATLAVIYWTLMWPGRFGVGSAFLVGLAVDVSQGGLLGEHALSLSCVAFLVARLHLQMRLFPLWQLNLSILALLFLEVFLLLWIDGATGGGGFGPERWGPPLMGAVLWAPLMAVMDRLRERLERRDSVFS